MNKNNNYQNGFALGGSIIAWALGLASLFGGAGYIANKNIKTQTPVRAEKTNIIMNRNNNNHDFVPDTNQLNLTGEGELSQKEIDGLISMREEEKLARDVYRTLYEKWNLQTFQNISYSENRHTLAIKALLDKYGIEDPVKDDTTGVFTISAMQKLYDDLVAQGSKSLIEALKVGATIEDLDIYDLKNWIADTDNSDVNTVYENLIRGSRNHMRSFIGQLKSNGGTYTAQYLSQGEIDDILKGDHERGMHAGQNMNAYGNRNGGGNGQDQRLRDGSGQGRGQGQGLRNGSGMGQGRGRGQGQGRMMRK